MPWDMHKHSLNECYMTVKTLFENITLRGRFSELNQCCVIVLTELLQGTEEARKCWDRRGCTSGWNVLSNPWNPPVSWVFPSAVAGQSVRMAWQAKDWWYLCFIGKNLLKQAVNVVVLSLINPSVFMSFCKTVQTSSLGRPFGTGGWSQHISPILFKKIIMSWVWGPDWKIFGPQAKGSKVHAIWRSAKYFPVWPDLTQSVDILLYHFHWVWKLWKSPGECSKLHTQSELLRCVGPGGFSGPPLVSLSSHSHISWWHCFLEDFVSGTVLG